MENVALIIPAAGVGERLNGAASTKKPWLPLCGKPIIFHTLDRFASIPSITQRILVVHPDDVEAINDRWHQELSDARVTDVTPGGATRQQSVAHGLAVLKEDIAIVAVHDSVRPFVSTPAIVGSIEQARRAGGAVVACKMTATVKRAAADGRIVETIPRDDLWMAQTPQTFRRELLVEAYAAAEQRGIQVTDDSSLLERVGKEVMVVEEAPTNIKITTPEDLRMARAMLSAPEQE